MQIRRRHPSPAVAVEFVRYQAQVPDLDPQHILEEIVWHKEKEVDQMRERVPLIQLQKQVRDIAPPRDFVAALRQAKTRPGLIAEVKKSLPQ